MTRDTIWAVERRLAEIGLEMEEKPRALKHILMDGELAIIEDVQQSPFEKPLHRMKFRKQENQ
jgi:hypothetical protein